MNRKETMSMRNVEAIPGIETLFSYNSEGDVTGVSVTADGGFYVRANYDPNHRGSQWKFADPSSLPVKCRAYHFTLRKMIHQALNWNSLAKEEISEK